MEMPRGARLVQIMWRSGRRRVHAIILQQSNQARPFVSQQSNQGKERPLLLATATSRELETGRATKGSARATY